MARDGEFYRDVLGMPLIKTIDLPGGMGQHFFFDIGNGDSPGLLLVPRRARRPCRGSSAAGALPGAGDIARARLDEPHRLQRRAGEVRRIRASAARQGRQAGPGAEPRQFAQPGEPPRSPSDVFVRSVYFWDPDGAMLEFAAWIHTGFTEADVAHEAVDASGKKSRDVVLKTKALQDAR